ncbi:hypothetical protein [Methylobacterium gregans]|uniref:Uncharacterized protein n=1 Tax=Methylobacterium gregans TaxID=374424 RepID=A0AA37HM19_9HYPH|nr:hypothetical protein [Methylobacterium gregans]MDQ0521957.1 hypothetical protein [Methylobacterium gregans]GJD78009.1 hypothetical protein NBEOAGPD_1221 [Methylobacterium gregans]GLS51978.1 hypothetical protein GCM10007886_01600 [Methylobacterium gregans]
MARIRMLSDFTYPTDRSGSVTRTLPAGGVFDEDLVVAEAAIGGGYAEPFEDEVADALLEAAFAAASAVSEDGDDRQDDVGSDDGSEADAPAEDAAAEKPAEKPAAPAETGGKRQSRAQA